MSTNVTEYSARFPLPTMLVRGRANTLTLQIDRAGSGITPTSGTVTVTDGGGTVIVSAASITAADPSTYLIGAGVLPATTALSDQWMIKWSIVFASGEIAEFQNNAYVVRRDLHPVLTQTDVTDADARYAEASFLASGATVQEFMDRAWERIQRKLIGMGRRPDLILSPWSLWDLHLAETAQDLDKQAASALNSNGRLRDAIEERRGDLSRMWGELVLVYDDDQQDDIDSDEQGIGVEPVIFIGKPAPYWRSV